MNDEMKNLLSADRPIENRNEDQLGRAGFARAIAEAVRGWTGNDSLVVGLFGPWGSGKSSIKNMMVEWLEDDDENSKAQVLEFNPWQFANRERLTTAFFDELGVVLGSGRIASKKDRKELVAEWRKYASYLQASGTLFSALKVPVAVLLGVLALVVFGTTVANAKLVGWIVGGTLAVVAGLLAWSSRVAAAIEKLLSGALQRTENMEDVKEGLASRLRKLEGVVCVILDDVDRLTPSEVQELFQLVKANADFPNLVYLVLGERSTIEGHITTALDVSGEEYLEKIVQVGFDVPRVGRSQLDNVLFQGLNEILEDERVAEHFEQVRWGNLYLGSLQEYFTNLRRVKRFLSTFSFHVSLLKGERAFEVNILDLISLEVLRIFEPEVYKAIARNKEALTKKPRRGRGGPDDQRRDVIRGIVDLASEGHAENVQDIIEELFPPAKWAFDGPTYGPRSWDRWYRELRVCSPDVFDRYFRLSIPEGDISQDTIDAILEASGDREEMRNVLEGVDQQGLLETALDRLEAFKEELPLEDFEGTATALFDLSRHISADSAGMFGFSPSMHGVRIVYWYLRREDDEAERLRMLRAAVDETSGIALPVRFVALEEQARDKEDRETLVDDEGLEELKEICVEKMRSAAEDGSLLEIPELSNVLHRWREWDDEERVRRFCQNVIDDPDEAVQLARAFVQRSTSVGAGDRVARENWYVKAEVVERFVPLDDLKTALDDFAIDKLSEEEGRAVSAVRDANAEQEEV